MRDYNSGRGNEVIGDDDYTVELWSPFAERAVRVLLMAAEPVLRENCQSTKALCDQFNVTRVIYKRISYFLIVR